jgi:GT2 family glycosyltransferase
MTDAPLHASVIIITYRTDRFDDVDECIEDVLNQQYTPCEVVIVADNEGTDTPYTRLSTRYSGYENITLVGDTTGMSLAEARNAGAEAATGEVYVFIDDDATPHERWLPELMAAYNTHNELAVGGPARPVWCSPRPPFLADEMLWLVGITHPGGEPPEDHPYVRNTFGCNISFRAEAFDAVGGFDPAFGKRRSRELQAEETELCVRLEQEFGSPVRYVSEAAVDHKVYDYQTIFWPLFTRAFWQGYSKALFSMGALSNEQSFLTTVPHAIARDIKTGAYRAAMGTFAFTLATACGFLYGSLSPTTR